MKYALLKNNKQKLKDNNSQQLFNMINDLSDSVFILIPKKYKIEVKLNFQPNINSSNEYISIASRRKILSNNNYLTISNKRNKFKYKYFRCYHKSNSINSRY